MECLAATVAMVINCAYSLLSAHSNHLIFRCVLHAQDSPDPQHMDGFKSWEFIKNMLHL